jgi:hypothetical protein
MTHLGQHGFERYGAPMPMDVRLVEHGHPASLAFDAQEPTREGPERLL